MLRSLDCRPILLRLIALAAITSTAAAVAATPPDGTLISDARSLAVVWNDETGSTGLIGAMSTEPPWAFQSPPLPIGPNAIARYADGRVYVVSRAAGTVSVICRDTWTVLQEHAVGVDSEPQDIAVVSPARAYVTRRLMTALLRLDPLTGEIEESVDLAATLR